TETAVTGGSEALDRETPRRTLLGFLHEAKEGDFRVAANYLDLRALPASSRDTRGPELAQKLAFVLERQPTLHVSHVPDTAEGDPNARPPDTVIVDTLYAGEEPVPITLRREVFADGVSRWLISQKTVELIPVIDRAYGPRPIGIPLPPSLTRPTFLGNELWQWIGIVPAIVVAYLLARIAAAGVVRTGAYVARGSPPGVDALAESARRPLRVILGALAFRALVEPLQLTTSVTRVCGHVAETAFILGVWWLLSRGLAAGTRFLYARTERESYDALIGRRVRTQAVLVQRVARVTMGFVAGSIILLQFGAVRTVGLSLLASAGVLGVVIGLAAQKSLSAVIGGIQFSVAQPVRIGDQVVVEGEFGDIEEINLTYVLVRLWDKRRLIVPIGYFLEKPFQNWTRTTTDLVGAVIVKVGFTMPIDALRQELVRICAEDPLWDKGTCGLQATDADSTSVTVRALVSAKDAGKLWDLRCNVREKLLAFVRSYGHGAHLAQSRLAIAPAQ
ncbi:MAG: mechanosensitive ion channel family protein, partial [Polyangiaceae bacterium]